MPSSSPSIQQILERRRRETFVGRDEQLDCFREQLSLAADDPRRRFVLGVAGQGGVGKTTLLRQYARLAEAAGAAVALSDQAESDAPAVMARLVGQLGASGSDPFRAFNERYVTYRRRRDELESQPDAPQGLAGLFARATVKGLSKVARNTMPGADLALDLLEDPLADQAGQWAEFVRRKLGNRDETQLVLEPAVVLSPLFVQGLADLAAGRRVALLFDTYEHTAPFLDGWLRELLNGRHGAVPGDVTFVAAGRLELDRNDWAELEPLLARLSLDPFSDEVARDYLARRGVSQEAIIAVILKLSGRLPLLLATLAAESPTDPAQMGDASGTAVERFLSWVEDPARRALALNAALPRRLNRDVVGVLGGDAAGFAWLVANPFVESRADGWGYHDVVREQMLRYQHKASPSAWIAHHEALAAYYRALRDELTTSVWEGPDNPRWREAAWEEMYHRLCARPDGALVLVLNGIAGTLDNDRPISLEMADVMAEAGRDLGHEAIQQWGEQLSAGLRTYSEGRYDEAANALSRLAEYDKLEPRPRSVVLLFSGVAHMLVGHSVKALKEFDRAITFDPQNVKAITAKGAIMGEQGLYVEAIEALDRAIALNPHYSVAIASRGEVYQEMGRYEEALIELSYAIEVDPLEPMSFIVRGETYRLMGRYDKALADFDRAVALEPLDAWTITTRGCIYGVLGNYNDALADFDRAIELNPNYAWAIANRGEIFLLTDRYSDALAAFNRAIELDQNYAWALARRGIARRLLGSYAEALADFDRAVELSPDEDWYLYLRTTTRRFLDPVSGWRDDLDRALALALATYERDPVNMLNLVNLALYHLAAGDEATATARYDEALPQATPHELREALRDLDDYLRLFPDDAAVGRLRALLGGW